MRCSPHGWVRTHSHSPLPRSTCSFLPLFMLASLLTVFLFSGCAQFPEGAPGAQVSRRLIVTFDVAGRINPSYYYFIALDTGGDPSVGPIPVVFSPWGNGWGTSNNGTTGLTHFVRYNQGAFTVHRIVPDTNLLQDEPIGLPFAFSIPETLPGGNRIRVVLDLDTLGDGLLRMNLNIITTDRIHIAPQFQAAKLYDALGAAGNDFVNFPVNINQIIRNAEKGLEEPGDLHPRPSPDVIREDLDIIDWTVEAQLL